MSQAQTSRSRPGLRNVDPVWSRIREEAEEIAAKDPSLGGFIFSNVLNYDTFEDALCHRLAQRLDHVDVCGELIV